MIRYATVTDLQRRAPHIVSELVELGGEVAILRHGEVVAVLRRPKKGEFQKAGEPKGRSKGTKRGQK